MTYAHLDLDSHRRPAATRAAGLARAITSALRSLGRRVVKAHESRRAVRSLMAMDDHALKDIGLNRGQILAAVHGGLDRPRR